MSLTRATDPNFNPPEGVHVSTKAKLILHDNKGNEFELLKVASATFIFNNGIGLYLQTGKQKGTTYSGLYSGRGSIRKAHLNMAGIRLVMGGQDRISDDLITLLQNSVMFSDRRGTTGIVDITRYPITNLAIEANIKTSFDPLANAGVGERREFTFKFYKVLFRTERITWDANDLIRSGPLDFIYSYPSISSDGTVSETEA